MKIGTERETHKLQTVINTNSDVVILIDHHLDQLKLASLRGACQLENVPNCGKSP